MQPRSVNEILKGMMPDFFQLTAPEKEVLAIEARDREWPKICAILEMDRERAA